MFNRVLAVPTCLALAMVAVEAYAKPPAARADLLPKPVKGENWQPGLDYYVFTFPMQYNRSLEKGEIEVLFPFLYTYGQHSDNEYLQEWLKKKPDYIVVTWMPDVRWPHAREQARMFFTLQSMGREDLRFSLYEWIYGTSDKADSPRYSTYHNLFYPDVDAIFKLNLEFAQKNGLDAGEFTSIYWSKEMYDKVRRAEFYSHLGGVGIGALVGGVYATSTSMTLRTMTTQPRDPKKYDEVVYGPENMRRYLQLIEYLAASERDRVNAEAAKVIAK